MGLHATNMGKLRKDLEKLKADLALFLPVNSKLKDKTISLERQCWSNSQHSRREKLEVTVDSSNVEDCQWLLGNGNKKIIIKLSKRKMLIKFERVKKS